MTNLKTLTRNNQENKMSLEQKEIFHELRESLWKEIKAENITVNDANKFEKIIRETEAKYTK